MRALTPFDTGNRLEPQAWAGGNDPDRFGRVDFDDDESATVFTAYAERLADGSRALHVEHLAATDGIAIYVDGVRWGPAINS